MLDQQQVQSSGQKFKVHPVVDINSQQISKSAETNQRVVVDVEAKKEENVVVKLNVSDGNSGAGDDAAPAASIKSSKEQKAPPPPTEKSGFGTLKISGPTSTAGLMIAAKLAEAAEDEPSEEESDKESEIDDQPGDHKKFLESPTKFFFHGKWFSYSAKSLFFLDKDNRFRRCCVWMLTHKRFDHFIVFLIMVNSLMLGAKDYADLTNTSKRNRVIDMLDIIFVSFFTLECLIKIIGMGFFLGKGSYLREAANWLDFVVVVCSLLTEIPQLQSVSGLRTFRLMRPLRSLTTMPSMRILITTLIASVAQLGGVMVLAGFFFTIFAILGVSLWSGQIYHRCRMTEFPQNGDWVIDPTDTQLCSSIRPCQDQRWCGSLPAASRSLDSNYNKISATVDIYGDSNIPELNYGFSNFNTLPSAFLTIFQCITLEGWIDIAHIFDDLFAPLFVNLFFLFVVVICSFFVLNLTIAVMLIKYEDADKSEPSSDHIEELREYGEEIGLPKRFVEFVIDQDSLQISASGMKILTSQKQKTTWKSMFTSKTMPNIEEKYYQNRLTVICFHIVNSPIFSGFIFLIIIANTVILALDKHPGPSQQVAEILNVFNMAFTIIFTFEVILKLVGLGVSTYCRDRFNVFDAIIVMVSILELSLASGGGFISALRALRLFRIFKLFRSGDLRTLLDSIGFTILTIKDYTILLALFIYVFALFGMSIFAGRVRFDENDQWSADGVPPRSNFDTLDSACLAVFEVMIGENWNSMMYNHMRSDAVGVSACVYFILLVCFGAVIMLNLFLAILLGNFDRARNFGEKKRIFESLEQLTNGLNYSLNIAITYLFNDNEFTRYIEEKILKCDEENLAETTELVAQQQLQSFDKHTETEIREVYYAMRNDMIEQVLAGEVALGSNELISEEELDKLTISDADRQRILEILSYIKRQNNMRRQRIDFQDQVKRTQAEREAIEDVEAGNTSIDAYISSDSDDEVTKSILELILLHVQSSSLLVFPQTSRLRKWCQLCVIAEEDEPTKPQEQAAGPSDPASSQKVGQTENSNTIMSPGQCDVSPKKSQEQMDKSPNNNSPGANSGLAISRSKGMISAIKRPKEKKVNIISKIFEGVILTLIVLSSITLALDNPMADPESSMVIFMSYVDNCFTILFTIEAMIKIIAMGFLFNNGELRSKGISPYIRDAWNVLDFIVVVSSLLDFIVAMQSHIAAANASLGDSVSTGDSGKLESLQSLKALRALRALRPLRMISRNPGMKLIVNALIASLPSMTNVTIVCFLAVLLFAILGVGFYKGTFGRCVGTDPESAATDPELVKDELDCRVYKGTWDVPNANFDNVLVAMRTLLEMMSTEGWLVVMESGIDGVPLKPTESNGTAEYTREYIMQQPQEEYGRLSILYFVAFMILGSQFVLNLFVGVIMDNFNKIKEKEEMGSLFVTEEQRRWLEAHSLGLSKALEKKCQAPKGWRAKFYNLVKKTWFENTITFFIVVNTLIMASKHDGISKDVESIFEKLNYLFAFVFNFEAVLKLIGLGKQYFYQPFDVFDFLVVIGTDIGIILKLTSSGSGFSAAAPVVRAFRIMRIVRLVRGQKNIQIILSALFNILPQITNFIALMFLLLFVYATLGISLFSGVVQQDLVNEKDNFTSVGLAMYTLFRCTTGEDWNGIMHELSITNTESDTPQDSPTCIQDQDYETFVRNGRILRGCGSSFAQSYFLCFTLLMAWLIMNLSVAAVIEGLEAAKNENTGIIEGTDVTGLIDRWQEYDAMASGWISTFDFICLVIESPLPFGDAELRKCQFDNQKEFISAKRRLFNIESYYTNDDRQIIIKNTDILRVLAIYKVKTYQEHPGRVHFKDVYSLLVKKAFKDSDEIAEDFEVSKHLKVKMKNQWIAKHKKVKGLQKSDFKLHQVMATQIIAKYVREYKINKAKRLAAEKLEESHSQTFSEKYSGDSKDVDNIKPEPEIIPSKEPNEVELANLAINESQMQTLNDPTSRAINERQNSRGSRIRNKDENPQEFEEVGSQEEQSEARAYEQINQNQTRVAINVPQRREPQRNQSNSMNDDNIENLNIQLDHSIEDSINNKSINQLLGNQSQRGIEEQETNKQIDSPMFNKKKISTTENPVVSRSTLFTGREDISQQLIHEESKQQVLPNTAQGERKKQNLGKQ